VRGSEDGESGGEPAKAVPAVVVQLRWSANSLAEDAGLKSETVLARAIG